MSTEIHIYIYIAALHTPIHKNTQKSLSPKRIIIFLFSSKCLDVGSHLEQLGNGVFLCNIKQKSAKCRLRAKSWPLPIDVKQVFLEHSHFYLCVIYETVPLQQQNWVVTTETRWPAEPKMLLSDCLQEKFADSYFRCPLVCYNSEPSSDSPQTPFLWSKETKQGLLP